MAKALINIPTFICTEKGQQFVNERVEVDLDQHPYLLKQGERYMRKHGRPTTVEHWRQMPHQARIAVVIAMMKEPPSAQPPPHFTVTPRRSISPSALTTALLRNQR